MERNCPKSMAAELVSLNQKSNDFFIDLMITAQHVPHQLQRNSANYILLHNILSFKITPSVLSYSVHDSGQSFVSPTSLPSRGY